MGPGRRDGGQEPWWPPLTPGARPGRPLGGGGSTLPCRDTATAPRGWMGANRAGPPLLLPPVLLVLVLLVCGGVLRAGGRRQEAAVGDDDECLLAASAVLPPSRWGGVVTRGESWTGHGRMRGRTKLREDGVATGGINNDGLRTHAILVPPRGLPGGGEGPCGVGMQGVWSWSVHASSESRCRCCPPPRALTTCSCGVLATNATALATAIGAYERCKAGQAALQVRACVCLRSKLRDIVFGGTVGRGCRMSTWWWLAGGDEGAVGVRVGGGPRAKGRLSDHAQRDDTHRPSTMCAGTPHAF